MKATLSILGLYKFEPTLFDLMQLPSGIDKTTLVNNLVTELAEVEILYPDADMLKPMIGAWSAKMLDNWTKLYNTTILSYNPIENYDRTETGSTREGGSDTSTGQSTSTEAVAAYNADPTLTKPKSVDSGDSTATTRYGHTTQHDLHVHGNIGVMSSQSMIREEREIDTFNVYDEIINDFARRFCIMVFG